MSRNKRSAVREAILAILDKNGGEVFGTNELSRQLNTKKTWVLKCLHALQRIGQITIISSKGGRGHRTIYKLIQASPGPSQDE